MRVPRIFHPESITLHTPFQLSDDAAGHVGRVLRMTEGQELTLFCGDGLEYRCTIQSADKKKVLVQANESIEKNIESPLSIHLGQVISRGDRMDFTLQKSVELGVTTITPLFSERCGVKLTGDRLEKKHQQWQKMVISACEQCGRTTIPEVRSPQQLNDWLAEDTKELKLNLHPRASDSIKTIPTPEHGVRLVIGPEGGLSSDEISQAAAHQFQDILIGPRVLRTETAAMTVITALQVQFGDLG